MMRSSVLFLLCFCFVLAAVLHVGESRSRDADDVEDDVMEMSRDKRQVNLSRRERRRQWRQSRRQQTDGDEEDTVVGRRRRPGIMRPGRRPGKWMRPNRGQRPGRRQRPHRRNRPNRTDNVQEASITYDSLGNGARRIVDTLHESLNTFSARMYAEIGRPAEDVIYSPYSIHQALTMTYMGARGRTALQMKRTLSLGGLGRRAHRGHKILNRLSNNTGNSTLKVANAVWAKPGINIEEPFRNGLALFYNSSITLFDMEHEGGPEVPINEWVSERTNTLIPSVLSPGTITGQTAMVLVNAIYFKANWNSTFDAELTSETMFSKSSSLQVPVQMMQIEENFKTGVLPGHAARVLELPYVGNRFSMVVILPDEIDGLGAIEEDLTADNLAVNLNTAVPTKIKVFLPRFKLETSMSLKSSLQNRGIGLAFSMSGADFSGINGGNDLYISDVIHRAVVEVNEEGSEAAAVTVVNIVATSIRLPIPVPEFRCDHPFLFLIRDNVSKVNLFVGKFSGGSQ